MTHLPSASLLAFLLVAGGGAPLCSTPWLDGPEPPSKEGAPASDPKFVLDHKVTAIDGKEVDLSRFKGKVVLVVNTASKCGYTPQYKDLQALYDAKKDKGFEVLGFPCNDFGSQEPGENADIAKFCSETYRVSFPMFAKVAVKGEKAAPLYKDLVAQAAPIGGEIKWNFTKFLIDRNGRVAYRFEPKAGPQSKDLLTKLDALLNAPAEGDKPASPAPAPKPSS